MGKGQEMKDSIILLGGGYSIKEAIKQGLWDRIKDKADIWSINFAYMTMPYAPTAECWLDTSFFRNQSASIFIININGIFSRIR